MGHFKDAFAVVDKARNAESKGEIYKNPTQIHHCPPPPPWFFGFQNQLAEAEMQQQNKNCIASPHPLFPPAVNQDPEIWKLNAQFQGVCGRCSLKCI